MYVPMHVPMHVPMYVCALEHQNELQYYVYTLKKLTLPGPEIFVFFVPDPLY